MGLELRKIGIWGWVPAWGDDPNEYENYYHSYIFTWLILLEILMVGGLNFWSSFGYAVGYI